jgi:hypothetical protein
MDDTINPVKHGYFLLRAFRPKRYVNAPVKAGVSERRRARTLLTAPICPSR